MPKTVRVLAADDNHLSFLEMRLRTIAQERAGSEAYVYELVETALDGKKLVAVYGALSGRGEAPDLVTLDIEMPEADGLWALHELKARFPGGPPVVMISSLTAEGAQRRYGESIAQFTAQAGALPPEKKRDLLARVAERIRLGRVEPGKANTMIDAGLRLGFDPIELARFLGARGFIVKPYKSSAEVTRVLDAAMEAGEGVFVTAGAG